MQGQDKLLVRGPVEASESIPEHLFGCLEAVFPSLATSDLRFSKPYQPILANHFAHCITRDSGDLKSHVRRIFLVCEQGAPQEVFSAVLDLFLALGKNGASLRRRMLEFSRARLRGPEYNLLLNSMATGLDPSTISFAAGSLLCQGGEGTVHCVHPDTGEAGFASRDPLIEAREYLEYSQLDEARNVLEQALLQQPERTDIQEELLSLYRSTRDKTNFTKMFRALDKEANPLPEAWRDLEEFFRSLNV